MRRSQRHQGARAPRARGGEKRVRRGLTLRLAVGVLCLCVLAVQMGCGGIGADSLSLPHADASSGTDGFVDAPVDVTQPARDGGLLADGSVSETSIVTP